ncbi:MAG TPA: bacillithiol biosynthesis cysteine-adding enzyme BshC [Longimicrobiales bacterium]|nr:bacillithiol biosynthesis cysteine-adding enzyme BshC [Longimicrobiales bacterium]
MNAPEILATQLGGPQLVRDYQAGASALAPFYAGSPFDLAAYRRQMDLVGRCFPEASRRAMYDAITPTSEAARAKLEAIAAGDGFFVSTGQQAGLFGGPLYTIYKTLSTIRLAAALEEKLGVTVAPLFWVAADDHDFAEVNHTYVIGGDNILHRIEIDGASEKTFSMNLHPLDASVGTAIGRLRSILPNDEISGEVLRWIEDAYVPGFSVAAAFKQLIESMFARFDLLVTSSADPVVKSLAAPVILRELEQSEQTEVAVGDQTDRLVAAGYHGQVTVRPGAVNVLYEDDEGRDRLMRDGDGWRLARTKRRFEKSELRDLLMLQPERFSPNVHLRPVVASAVFPTLAYVGGPAEISYFGQIGGLFAAHNVPMPLVAPRASMDIVEYKVQKVLDKFSLKVSDVQVPFNQLVSQVMRDELPADVTKTINGLRDRITQSYDHLVSATHSIDPTLKGPLENTRNMSLKSLLDIDKKIVSHSKKKNEVGVDQLRKASASLFPEGVRQERSVNAVSYLTRYGAEFLDTLANRINIDLSKSAPDWSGVKC